MAFTRRSCDTPKCGYIGFTESSKCPKCNNPFDTHETSEFGIKHEKSMQKSCRNCLHGQVSFGTGKDDTTWFDCTTDGNEPTYVSLLELGRRGCPRWEPKHLED